MRTLALGSLVCVAALATGAVLSTVPAIADDRPYPAGTSSQQIEGLTWSIVMPADFDPGKKRSLVVILHGAGGTETGMAGSLAFLAEDDYVVAAPKSKGQVWETDDLERVRRGVAGLRTSLRIGKSRLHGAGFSNGGWNLAPIVFDEELHFTSACWIAAGHRGGKPPKHAKKGMGVLALAGAEDGNRDAAEATPGLLEDDVRSAECRIQPNLGHKWPGELMPYYAWWLGVQEGRFVPGVTLAFAWDDGDADPPPPADDGKGGSFVYWFDTASDGESEEALLFQNETLQDPTVRFFGSQLRAAKRDRAADPERFTELKLKSTPAVVVYDAKGKVKKTLSGTIKAKSLAAALRGAARIKKPPKK